MNDGLQFTKAKMKYQLLSDNTAYLQLLSNGSYQDLMSLYKALLPKKSTDSTLEIQTSYHCSSLCFLNCWSQLLMKEALFLLNETKFSF